MTTPNRTDLQAAWLALSTNGLPPDPELAARVLPEWSVGISGWIDQIAEQFLQGYCRERSHYKLVIAPYGGGKSHFLLAMRQRALEEHFAVSYLRCSADTRIDNWSSLFPEIASSIHLPGEWQPGLSGVIDAAMDTIRKRASATDDPEATIDFILASIRNSTRYASPIFSRLVAIILSDRHLNNDADRANAANIWLSHGQNMVSKAQRAQLGVQNIPAAQTGRHGEQLFHSLVRFLKEFVGMHGLVLLLDETDMMFNTRGRAMARLMAALRTLIDQADDALGPIPVLGMLAAVPNIDEQLQQYAALQQRFSDVIPFEEGAVNAPRINLAKCMKDHMFLVLLGEKLLHLSENAFGRTYDADIQRQNIELLSKVACSRMTDIDSRRLFVKTWCAVLDQQAGQGNRQLAAEEAANLLQGVTQSFHQAQPVTQQEDIG